MHDGISQLFASRVVTASARRFELRPLALLEAHHFLTQRLGRLPPFPSSHHSRHNSDTLGP